MKPSRTRLGDFFPGERANARCSVRRLPRATGWGNLFNFALRKGLQVVISSEPSHGSLRSEEEAASKRLIRSDSPPLFPPFDCWSILSPSFDPTD